MRELCANLMRPPCEKTHIEKGIFCAAGKYRLFLSIFQNCFFCAFYRTFDNSAFSRIFIENEKILKPCRTFFGLSRNYGKISFDKAAVGGDFRKLCRGGGIFCIQHDAACHLIEPVNGKNVASCLLLQQCSHVFAAAVVALRRNARRLDGDYEIFILKKNINHDQSESKYSAIAWASRACPASLK